MLLMLNVLKNKTNNCFNHGCDIRIVRNSLDKIKSGKTNLKTNKRKEKSGLSHKIHQNQFILTFL